MVKDTQTIRRQIIFPIAIFDYLQKSFTSVYALKQSAPNSEIKIKKHFDLVTLLPV